MLHRIILAMLLISPIALLGAAQQQPAKPKSPVPQLPAQTNWGMVTQNGHKFTLSGHPDWSAEGEIRDGKAYILWTDLISENLAPSMYQLVVVNGTAQLHGLWGFIDDVHVDRQQGTIIGDLSPDTVYSTEEKGSEI